MKRADRLEREADRRGVVVPQDATLRKYGLDRTDWLGLLEDQGWVCGVCGRFPTTGKFVTDHEHVRGWKAMSDEDRARYVRGLTCWYDNRYLLAGKVTPETARQVLAYVERYEERRPGA